LSAHVIHSLLFYSETQTTHDDSVVSVFTDEAKQNATQRDESAEYKTLTTVDA